MFNTKKLLVKAGKLGFHLQPARKSGTMKNLKKSCVRV